jgi:pimeloyl-ACP methyl ester carboxylesterase
VSDPTSSLDDDSELPLRRMTTPDGVELAAYDLGGEGPDALFVHATGFCGPVLLPLARRLGDRFHCWALDLRAHGRSGRPGDGNLAWSGFCTDVLTAVDSLGLVQPHAFGHSSGGASILLAEEARPGTFPSLYCFEPVVFDAPQGGPPMHNPLTEGARRRRETFPSFEDAFVNFSSKPPFAELDPDVLRLYVDGGFELVPDEEGGDGRTIRLRCRRDDEAAIYERGASHGAFGHLPEIGCPVVLCCGENTDAFGLPLLRPLEKRIPRCTVEVAPGLGHFGPMQDPPLVARMVLQAWTALPESESVL